MKPQLSQRFQFTLAYLLVTMVVLSFLQSWLLAPRTVELSMSQFLELLRAGKIEPGAIPDREIRGIAKPDALPTAPGGARDRLRELLGSSPEVRVFTVTRIPGVDEAQLIAELEAHRVEFTGKIESMFLRDLFFGWILPLGIMIAIWMFLMRRVGGGPTQALSFGRSKHKIYDRKELKTTFADVAGVDEAKAELVEIVDFLQNPKKYQRLGGRIPKGVLLVGPPGTGKTLLARAVAGEADVPFFTLSGSEFVEMFVGVGAARVRDLFEQAKDKAPCIIFIDELDAIGKSRAGATGFVGGHDEREQTLNQLLAEMDGFDSSKGVIIMAATNRPEVLDLALLRPGRFDRQVVVDKPDIRGREAILKLHARNVVLAPSVDLGVIAARTPGFAGADLANIVNEAALLAARKEQDAVGMADFEEAIDRGVAGLEKKSRVLSEKERDIGAHRSSSRARGWAASATTARRPRGRSTRRSARSSTGPTIGCAGSSRPRRRSSWRRRRSSSAWRRWRANRSGVPWPATAWVHGRSGADDAVQAEHVPGCGRGRPADRRHAGRRRQGPDRARTVTGASRDGSGPAAHRAGANAATDRVVRRGGGDDQALRHQHQHGVAGRRPPGAHAVRGVLRRGVLPPLLRRAARAHPAAEPRLGRHRGPQGDRPHQRARRRAGDGHRGDHARRQQAQGESRRARPEDRPRRAPARRRQGHVPGREGWRLGPGPGGRLGARRRIAVRPAGDRDGGDHQRQGAPDRPGAVRRFPPDRRPDQPGQLRWAAGEHAGRSDRHQHGDRPRRLRPPLRPSLEHGPPHPPRASRYS